LELRRIGGLVERANQLRTPPPPGGIVSELALSGFVGKGRGDPDRDREAEARMILVISGRARSW